MKSDPRVSTGRKLSTGEVAALFGVQIHTVRRWVEAGRIHYLKTPGGQYRFDAEYIHRMLQNADQ